MFILHLSDLHFLEKEDTSARWYSSLANDLKRGLEISKLDGLVLSGDIANHSTEKEYIQAQKFIELICDEFKLNNKHIVIVPGNHDLNWTLSRDAYEIYRKEKFDNEYEGKIDGNRIIRGKCQDCEFVQIRNEDDAYKKRFQYFASFYKNVTGSEYSLEYDKQATFNFFEEKRILFLGLNSAWEIDHFYETRISIHQDALSQALNKVRKEYDSWLKIAIWHHPLRLDFINQLCQLDFQIALHGHIHKADNQLFRSQQITDLEIIGAGTFGAETVQGYPFQYNLLEFNNQKLIVHTRCRESSESAWRPDTRWPSKGNKNYLPEYIIPLNFNLYGCNHREEEKVFLKSLQVKNSNCKNSFLSPDSDMKKSI